MKTIIIPTDFSPVATNAMHYGLEMARSVNASLLLFHAYQVPVSYSDVPIILVSVDELKKSAEERLETLKKEVEHISSGAVKIYTEAVMGNFSDELENICQKINPFAVVMGSKGSAGIERVLFGSNTLAAIKHITWPVIAVPPGKTFGNGIQKIGFACDFRNIVETTPAAAILEMVNTFNAELHVLNVDYHDKHFKPDTPEQSVLLHTLLESAKPVYHFIEHRDVEDGINEFADKNNLDLLITIPKKHKLLEGLFHRSSTKELIVHSHVPVMCVHE
ncbi:MAG TPA: universal stress protein [Chitinophagaceae bacterium]|jgi:nucleotide-binding universal stress UspA family protein|nr:universal stress protein [Chitinophagaceae bacterium]